MAVTRAPTGAFPNGTSYASHHEAVEEEDDVMQTITHTLFMIVALCVHLPSTCLMSHVSCTDEK